MTSEAMINHLNNNTNCCYAPNDRYCAIGRELWLEYRAECVATGGRATMEAVRHQTPEWADEIKSRALILMGENNNQWRAA